MSQWISVKDHMPEEDDSIQFYKDSHMQMTSVLACGYTHADSKKMSVREVNRLLLKKTGIKYIDDNNEPIDVWHWSRHFYEVTHWMPLPEPPGGAE